MLWDLKTLMHYYKVVYDFSPLHLGGLQYLSRRSILDMWVASLQALFVILFAIAHYSSFHLLVTVLLPHITVCISLYQQPSYSCVIPLVLFDQGCHVLPPPVPPFVPSLCLFDILSSRRLGSFSVLFVCHPALLMSSLMSPFSQSLSNLLVLYHPSFSCIQ